MDSEIQLLREQINEKNFIIRSLFSLKLFKREEDNLSHMKETYCTELSRQYLDLQIKRCPEIGSQKQEDRYFPGAKIKDMNHYAIPLLEKKPVQIELKGFVMEKLPTIIFIILRDFLMFYQIFFSPQVKRWAIISNKHGISELPHDSPNDICLRILRNQEISENRLNFIE